MMIFLAEMGDKTQILSMAFATQFALMPILMGVAIGAGLNHGIAIVLGAFLTRFVPMDMLQLVAGGLFLFFAFWTLSVDDEEDEDEAGKGKFGPIITVALAFFLGELGDKTQLTALSLGASSAYPQVVLLGTVTGMVLTSLIGIFIGLKLGKKIPEMQLKLGAFAVFMFFGLEKIVNSPYTSGWTMVLTGGFLTIIAVLSGVRIRGFMKALESVGSTKLTRQAGVLRSYHLKLKSQLDGMCLTESVCEVCSGDNCLVGNLRRLLDGAISGDKVLDPLQTGTLKALVNKPFSKTAAEGVLATLETYYDNYPEEYKENEVLTQVRQTMEMIVFEEAWEPMKDYDAYKAYVSLKSAELKNSIRQS